MQAEEFLCTPDKVFLFVIFPAMHVGMERSKHQDMNGIVALLAADPTRATAHAEIECRFSVWNGWVGEMVSLMLVACMHFANTRLGPNQIGYW